MRVEYDRETDTLTITLRDARVNESDEIRPGVIADFGYDGGVAGFEILDTSKVVDQTREMQFAVAGRSSYTRCRVSDFHRARHRHAAGLQSTCWGSRLSVKPRLGTVVIRPPRRGFWAAIAARRRRFWKCIWLGSTMVSPQSAR